MVTETSAPPGSPEATTRFLDAPEGAIFPALRWLTPRRLAYFLVFWISIFFAGSIFVNNPFAGSSGASNWDLGAAFPNYYWVVMYLHGLNTGLVGLAALIACDVFELTSIRIRKSITAGVLFAGVLAPLGAIFNTTAPWTNAGLWVQIAAFLALDEILVVFLLGMLDAWRSGEPRSRTLPFITVVVTGGTMLVAALIGHLAGTILGFGNNPPLFGEYANAEIQGAGLSDFAAQLIGAHAYLMISAVPAGILSLVAVRFGYYRLTGWVKRMAQVGFALIIFDLVLQVQLAVMAGFTDWPGDLPREISSLPGVPTFLALNDAIDFGFLIVGGLLLFVALLLGSRSSSSRARPISLPVRVLPLLAFVEFTVLTFATEPSDGTALGPPPLAWLRLFIAFYVTMLLALVVLLAERTLTESEQGRIGWMTVLGSLVMSGGVLVYLYQGATWGGYVAVAGLVLIGVGLLSSAYWGLSARRSAPGATPPLG